MAYEFVSEDRDRSGYSVSLAGDVDGDGQTDLLIGAPRADGTSTFSTDAGRTYLILAADLAALDAADGVVDGIIHLEFVAATGGSYDFVGQNARDQSGFSVSAAGDVNNDGLDDLLIGAFLADNVADGEADAGSAYLIDAADLADLDAADGAVDGIIDLDHVPATGTSYEFVGEDASDLAGASVRSAGDVDGDGRDDFLIGAYSSSGVGNLETWSGSTYLINADDLADLDAADGTADGIIDLASVAATGTSYEFIGQDEFDYSGWSVSSAGDVDGDGKDDLLIGANLADGTLNTTSNVGSTYLINADDLADLDAADGVTDGIIDLTHVGATGTSYEFVGERGGDQSGHSVSSAGDVDGDGLDDLLIGAFKGDGFFENNNGNTYLINAGDLADLDAADGATDGIIELRFVPQTGTSYVFFGRGRLDEAGVSVRSAGDVDGDGLDDFLIGAHFADGIDRTQDRSGRTYLINASDLAALDAADGTSDGRVDLFVVPATGTSYAFVGDDSRDESGFSVSSAGDVDGDGLDDLLIGAWKASGFNNSGGSEIGSTYLIEADQLAFYDARDGAVDGIVDLGLIRGDLTGTGNDDTIMGGDADDILTGLNGQDSMDGGDGDDTLNGNGGDDTMFGDDGADIMIGGGGRDSMMGELGDDDMFGGNGFDTMHGGDGGDDMAGGKNADRIYGDAGDDTLDGGPGSDRLWGGDDADLMLGSFGDDILRGEAGNDTLNGNGARDRLFGDAGDDLLNGGNGFDRINGGSGDDTLNGGSNADGMRGDNGADLLNGDAGADNMDGGAGDDTLNGGTGTDKLVGRSGSDALNGGAGDDRLQAGGGRDTLTGGEGDDLMSGGSNPDTFVFQAGHGADTITDFNADLSAEKIDLSALGFTDLVQITGPGGAASTIGGDVLIDTGGGNSILLEGVGIGDLDGTDFIFG